MARTKPTPKARGYGVRVPGSRDAISVATLAASEITLVLGRKTREGKAKTPHLTSELGVVVPGFPTGIRNTRVFTNTTKMRCPSWSLPAGPARQGGTCLASDLRPVGRLTDEWICEGCYALGGNYQYPSVQATQAIRKAWTVRRVRAGTFAEEMVAALRQYVAAPRTRQDLRFFRVHDSGDFSWRGEVYVRAWFAIARALPKIHFWAPTRDWTAPLGRRFVPLLSEAPSNFTVRPSALFKGEAPPVVPGLAAGTSVVPTPPRTVHLTDPSGQDVFNCPAYAAKEHTCVSGKNPDGKTGCRACWTRPALQINYSPHGTLSKDGGLVQLRLKRNPAAPLAALYAAYRRDTRGPGEVARLFPAYLAHGGLSTTDFSERAWRDLLTATGVTDPDEQVDVLESLMEW